MRSLTRFLAAVCIVAGMLQLTVAPADAGRIKKYCQGDNHMHFGSGSGPSKRAAHSAAIRAWADFVVIEYGGAFGNFRIARFKRVTCGRSGAGWVCNAEANPCRKAR